MKPGETPTAMQAGETATAMQPGETPTAMQPGETATAMQPGATATARQAGKIATAIQPGETATARQAGETATARQAGATATARQPGKTATARQPGKTATARQAGATATARQAGATATARQAGATATASQPVENVLETTATSGDSPPTLNAPTMTSRKQPTQVFCGYDNGAMRYDDEIEMVALDGRNNERKLKLVVCGAAGMLGKDVIVEALELGHEVTAVVRDPSLCPYIHSKLTVATGNLFDKSTLDAIFPGHDAVINCAGFPKKPVPVTGYTDTIENIIAAMRDASISRIVIRTTWYTDRKSAGRSGFWAKWVLVPMIRSLLINMHEMEMYLEAHCQDMNYTVVRHSAFNKKKKTGYEIIVSEDYFVKTKYPIYQKMSRKDVAEFMVKILEAQEYKNKMISIVAEMPPFDPDEYN